MGDLAKQLTIYIDKNLKKKLMALADKERRSTSQMICILAEEAMLARENKEN